MQDIAARAGVGKATVFRRFGDRTALIAAVVEPRAGALRDALESGPPPLGPSGAAADALAAHLDALLAFVWHKRPPLRALEGLGPHAYYDNDFSRFWVAEFARRLRAIGADGDADYLAHAVFTSLRADVVDYLVTGAGMDRERIRDKVRPPAGLTVTV